MIVMSQIKKSHNWTMVTAVDFRSHSVVHHFAQDPLRHQNVIQSPAHVLRPGIRHVRPECVRVLLAGVKVTEGVHEFTTLQEVRHTIAFLLGETGVLLVRFGIRQICRRMRFRISPFLNIFCPVLLISQLLTDLFMGHIHVSANYNRLLPVQILNILLEQFIPPQSLWQRDQFATGIRHVHIDQEELFIFGGHQSPFLVHLLVADAVANVQRHLAGIDTDTRLSTKTQPVRVISYKGYLI